VLVLDTAASEELVELIARTLIASPDTLVPRGAAGENSGTDARSEES
jgi:hypothetical protein